MANREPNTQECLNFGRKMGNIEPEIEVFYCKDYLSIGSNNDDEIYFGECGGPDGEPSLKERVKVSAFGEIDEYQQTMVEFDLEDLLRFAAKYCRGIYDRVGKEETQA